jgi:hypothetical protein
MCVSRSGHAECTHFNIRYPMPLGPGADVSKAVLRAEVISSGVMGVHRRGGWGGGSSSWVGWTGCGVAGKKCCWKICALRVGLSTRLLSESRRGGKAFIGWPFWTLASDQMSCASTTWCSRSCAQLCFAWAMPSLRAFEAVLGAGPGGADRAAVCRRVHSSVHHLAPLG